MFSETMVEEKPRNMPFITQGSPGLIREGDRIVGSGRVLLSSRKILFYQ